MRHFDLYNFEVADGDPQMAFYGLRDGTSPATFWSPYNGGHWMVTRAATIEAMINDAEYFGSAYIGPPKELNPKEPRVFRPLQLDPPHNQPYRRFILTAITPKLVRTLKEDARQLTIRLVDELRGRGECEFVTAFAQHMPIQIFMSMVGLSETDRPILINIAHKIARPQTDDERMEGYALLDNYIAGVVNDRRDAGLDDFTGRLCRYEIDGRLLNDNELFGVMGLTLVAGLDTVAGMLTFFARHLADNPGHRRQLRDNPQMIPGAVEELLRRYAQVNVTRVLRKDRELDGVLMKEGDLIVAPLVLHNLDETKFSEPLRVDLERPRNPQHLSFGGQVHHCLGALLARAELEVFLEEWLPRIPDFAIAPGTQLQSRTRVNITLPRLPLVWDV